MIKKNILCGVFAFFPALIIELSPTFFPGFPAAHGRVPASTEVPVSTQIKEASEHSYRNKWFTLRFDDGYTQKMKDIRLEHMGMRCDCHTMRFIDENGEETARMVEFHPLGGAEYTGGDGKKYRMAKLKDTGRMPNRTSGQCVPTKGGLQRYKVNSYSGVRCPSPSAPLSIICIGEVVCTNHPKYGTQKGTVECLSDGHCPDIETCEADRNISEITTQKESFMFENTMPPNCRLDFFTKLRQRKKQNTHCGGTEDQNVCIAQGECERFDSFTKERKFEPFNVGCPVDSKGYCSNFHTCEGDNTVVHLKTPQTGTGQQQERRRKTGVQQ